MPGGITPVGEFPICIDEHKREWRFVMVVMLAPSSLGRQYSQRNIRIWKPYTDHSDTHSL